ncbi:inositol monophosphatase family protein [Hahella ganghwensis]|uniref:inositol monophosphatase family protein n=1 Tax=Hahella ganghwensis TaxID=286420 RepID=UPI000382BE9B|nr:inositol monophosphatase family protein [Hahella ganghwensis]
MSQWLSDISIFAVNLALKAGEVIEKEQRHAAFETQYKSHQELVTSADLKVDEMIRKSIQANFPDHQILSEESANDLSKIKDSNAPLWVVDPIDGTVNFAYGHSQVAVSIAYFEGGEAKVGVVHAPMQNETFHAIRGQFSHCNHKPISVSGETDFRQSLIATGFPYHKETVHHLVKRLEAVLGECRDIRRIGSAALDICWVAMGRLDAYYETVSPWDFAAARLIASEAGARCGHLGPVPDDIPEELFGTDNIIATPAIYDRLKELLQEADGRE